MFAILYTGEVRTMESVIDIFIKNVVVNENVHVHAVLQSPTPNDIVHKIGNNLKSLQWFDPLDTNWLTIKNKMANNIDPHWYDYIVNNSGSMVEYYQLYWAYLQMEAYEKKHDMKYDYILRIRCDCVITRPFCYDWIKYTKEQIDERLTLCKSSKIFMNSLLDSERYLIDIYIERSGDEHDVHQLLKDNYFLITFRENVMYFGSRKVFEQIHTLGIHYGQFKSDDHYWCNSEAQLKLYCKHYGIHVYDSSTVKENKSLYEYDEHNYYSNGELINQRDVLFFLKRQ